MRSSVVRFLQALVRALDRALIAAELAHDRTRDEYAAKFLDRMVEDAVAEDIVPRIREEQKQAGTWARTAVLSGRGVPSRAQRSISARIAASIVSSGT